jgi:Putative zinc-finger
VADQNKFGKMPDATPGSGGLRCEEWEALLVDALDGLLPAGDTAAFHAHSANCMGCADLLAHAKQGQEWLEYLHTEPEVPAGLVSKILDKTAGAGAIPVQVIAGAGTEQVVGASAVAVPWRRSFQETRLLMTVAMAFFSIALTLNMAGVKLTSLRLADLRPGTIGSTISRQFWGAQSSVVRFYDNMRFVYQLQSKVRELRRDTQTQPATPKKQSPSSRNDGAEPTIELRAQNAAHSVERTGCSVQGAVQKRAENIAATTHEVKTPDTHEAGPRRIALSAGCKGRSLA